jgi:peptidoglycan hydrolase-like protein with peptidoglycan-binding domain
MSEPLQKGKDWTADGVVVPVSDEARTQFRGLQADLNMFGEKLGFDRVKVDGKIGPKTAAAVAAVANGVGAGIVPAPGHATQEDVAANAAAIRGWLLAFAVGALGVTKLRRYERGTGKDWNVKDQIAYGAGEVHEEFKALQMELNRFANIVGFETLSVDGFIGQKTAAAVTKVYTTVVAKNPGLAATPFPPPDTKEEAAEYGALIRWWLGAVASKALIAEA